MTGKKTTAGKGKNLFIGLGKGDDIQKIIQDYIKESNLPNADFPFATGYVQHLFNKNPKDMEQLLYLLQTYFYAGVYYGKSSKRISFGYVTQKEKDEKTNEIKKQIDKLLNKEEVDISYMG